MKKLILILLVAMLANSVTASSIPTDTTQKILAKPIVFITGGVLLPGIGTTKLPSSSAMTKAGINAVPVTAKVINTKTVSNSNTGNDLFTSGIVAIITGEPLFVVSSRHKERAFSVSTTEQVIKKMQRNSISRVSIPSIKLTIHL
ncbi:hypothetical protein WG954_05975 [Lacibacter sp. H375]|uniref:hypothetical protein n=1 Tax=Lacibacter sp. H375 TaxID=3133424 RepID=UPI0030BF960B